MLEYGKFLEKLSRAGIQYATVGGLAVGLNGFVRATEDVALLVDDSPENLKKLIRFLENFGEGKAKGLTLEDFSDEEGCIRIIEDFPIDIFTKMSGKKLKDFGKGVVQTRFGEVEIPHLDAESIIWLKKNSWREKDKLDVVESK